MSKAPSVDVLTKEIQMKPQPGTSMEDHSSASDKHSIFFVGGHLALNP